MFTDRQLDLLAYLNSAQIGVPGQELADLLKISSKTLQSEIKTLNHYLEEKASISYHSLHGYQLEVLDESLLQDLAAQSEVVIIEQDPLRVGLIMTLLAFERDYLSMEKISERLYLSKTSVSRELETNWRMRRRLEVSKTKGIKMILGEDRIRLLLSHILPLNPTSIRTLTLEKEYQIYWQSLKVFLVEFLLGHDRYLSGDSMKEFVQYIFFMLLRIEKGFHIETISNEYLSPLMEKLATQLEDHYAIHLSLNDRLGMQQKFNQLSYLHPENQIVHHITRDQTEQLLESFRRTLLSNLSLEFNYDHLIDSLSMYLNRLFDQTQQGDQQANFHKREINATYYLTAHLLSVYLAPLLPFKLLDADFAHLILFFAPYLETPRVKQSLLLVSNQPPAYLHQIEQQLKQLHLDFELDQIEVVSAYLSDEIEADSLIITTENKISFLFPNSIKIDPLLRQGDLMWLEKELNAQSVDKPEEEQLILSKHPGGQSLESYFQQENYSYNLAQYDIIMTNPIGFYPTIVHDCPSHIRIIKGERPFTHKSRTQTYLILSQFNPSDAEIHSFYRILGKYFDYKYLNQLFK